jgi:hypothetical protein
MKNKESESGLTAHYGGTTGSEQLDGFVDRNLRFNQKGKNVILQCAREDAECLISEDSRFAVD